MRTYASHGADKFNSLSAYKVCNSWKIVTLFIAISSNIYCHVIILPGNRYAALFIATCEIFIVRERVVFAENCHAKIVPGENCTDRYTIFATKIVPPGTILVAKSVPALPKVYRVGRKGR